MRTATRTGKRRLLPKAAAVLVFVLALLAPLSAAAMTNAKVTLNQDTGGKPARFTFLAITDADGPTDSVDLTFPDGFDLSKIRVVADTLKGVQVTSVKYTVAVDETTLKMSFAPAVPPNTQLRVLMYEVLTRYQGGDFELGVHYAVNGQARELTGVPFSYETPPPWERAVRWLDGQGWVEKWNKVTFLDIFLRPQLIVEAIFLGFFGWLVSIGLVAVAFPLAITGGLILAFMKMAKIPPVRWPASIYVNVIRGTPLFLQIYIAFVGLRIVGIRVNDFLTGVIVLMLNSSAYLAEIFRAGIQSIHKGQFEAAYSLGMTYPQAMRFVIIPQTVKRVLPTMTSEFILLFKDTALLFPVGVFELMMYSNQIVARSGNLTAFMVAAGYYLIITIPLISWVTRLEARLAISEHGQSAPQPKRRAGLFWRAAPSAEPALSDSEAR